MRIVLALVAMATANVFAAGDEVSVESLLKGSKVPLRREFPLSTKIKPCDDFHRYVCERAESAFKLPKDRSSWFFSFSDSGERMLHIKKAYFKLLTEGLEPKLERTKNVKRIYQACMNVEQHKIQELAYVKEGIEAILGPKDHQALVDLFNRWQMTPDGLFVGVFEIANQDNPDRNDVGLAIGGLSLAEKSYYLEKIPVADLHIVLEALFRDLKVDKPKERAAAVVEFEKGLAKSLPAPEEFRKLFSDNTYQKLDVVKAAYPHIEWQRIFGKIPAKTAIRVITKDSFAFMDKYLAEAPLFDLQSIMLYNRLKVVMDDAYPTFRKASIKFALKHLGGPPVEPPRDERCTGAAMALGQELDAELLAVLYPNFDGAKVREIAESVRASLLEGIKRNTWLSESARKEAVNKIKSAPLRLVKPDRDEDWSFAKIGTLSETNFVENQRTLAESGLELLVKRIREDRKRSQWFTGPLTVNAFYSAEDNQFFLPQGILQYPFFDVGQTRIENLAAMGMVVGHELGHGVDDEGAKYDSKGKLRNWMTPADLKAFGERGAKLIAQFDKVGHNGKLTLGENIGDNVGLYFSLHTAFPKMEEANVEDLRKFFVSYGRLWCNVMRPATKKVMVKTNPHALPEARINQQVMHKDPFYKAFACKAGDKMYLKPEDRVQVW